MTVKTNAEALYLWLSKRPPHGLFAVLLIAFLLTLSGKSHAQLPQSHGPVRITLDEAIEMAIQHNHNMLAMVTTIQQSQAEEITQGLRPNPTLFADWDVFATRLARSPKPGPVFR